MKGGVIVMYHYASPREKNLIFISSSSSTSICTHHFTGYQSMSLSGPASDAHYIIASGK
jgi:hypothetical protein